MKSAEQKIAEIRKPPSLANWVRLNARRQDDTTQRIARFVLGKPRHALALVYRLIADYVTLGTSARDVRADIDIIKNPLVRKLGHEIATALLPWLDKENIKGIEAFHDMVAPFPIGRGIVIPVKPTFVFNKAGKLIPVFVIGWSSMPLMTFTRSCLQPSYEGLS